MRNNVYMLDESLNAEHLACCESHVRTVANNYNTTLRKSNASVLELASGSETWWFLDQC
jgi:hypothetical protein